MVFDSKVSNRVGLWYNLQPNHFKKGDRILIKFQTELVCGIICNKAIGGGVVASLNSFKPSWFVA